MREGFVVPNIADGNPSAMWAAMNLAEQSGEDTIGYEIALVTKLGGWFHDLRSRDPKRSERYTEESDKVRSGRKAQVFTALSGIELRGRMHRFEPDITRLNFFQELPMAGLGEVSLKRSWVKEGRLFVPDTFPKKSGEDAVRNFPGKASLVVWNSAAEEMLLEKGFEVDLRAPWILDGLRPDGVDFRQGGDRVVVKASGSGMPRAWRDELVGQLSRFKIDTPWSVHDKKLRFGSHHDGAIDNRDRRARIENYYNALGGNTRLMICYPSELIGVAANMRARGVPVVVLALAPRGRHELENMRVGIEEGVVMGQVDFKDAKNYFGLERVRPADIGAFLNALPTECSRPGYLGTEPIFSSTASEWAMHLSE